MKKTAILTFYDSANYGAFWQAKCLKDYLNSKEKITCDILKIELRKDNLKQLKCVYYFLSGRISFGKMIFEINRYGKFKKNLQKLKPKSPKDLFDIYIWGSDEIWNIKKKQNREGKAKILWGMGMPRKSIKIAYAPSVNEAKEEDFEKESLFKEKVCEFKALSARDQNSVDVLEKVLKRKVELVIDPTLLQGIEYFQKYEPKNIEEKEDYLLLYTYEILLTPKEIRMIKSFAKEKRIKIISIGNYVDFADKSLVCTPEQLLLYFRKATYVFTNTFHGTMFSIIYRKNCGILNSHQTKVDEAISQFGLEKLRVSDLDDTWNLDDRNLSLIWDDVYKIVERYRNVSDKYLLEAIYR